MPDVASGSGREGGGGDSGASMWAQGKSREQEEEVALSYWICPPARPHRASPCGMIMLCSENWGSTRIAPRDANTHISPLCSRPTVMSRRPPEIA